MDNHDAITAVQDIIESIVAQMGIEVRVEVEQGDVAGLVFSLHTNDTQSLIGRQGSTLYALQMIVQQIAVKRLGYGSVPHFSLDVDDYRRKRMWYIKETTRQAIEKTKRTGYPVTLDPMPNYERRLVHAYIQEHFADILSESTGEGSSRRVVIRENK